MKVKSIVCVLIALVIAFSVPVSALACTPCQYKYTVKYIDIETGASLRADSVKYASLNVAIVSAAEAAPVTISGYKYESASTTYLYMCCVESKNVIKLYYRKCLYNYEIRYYKDSVSDANRFDVVTGSGSLGQTISVYHSSKIPTGYSMASGYIVAGSASVISSNPANNIVNVVYNKECYNYTVRYLDSETNQPLRADSVKSAKYQSVITSASEAAGISFTGYEFDTVKTPVSITISTNGSGNVLNLYYKKATYNYEIRYYKDFVSESNRFDSVAGSGILGQTINVVQSQKIPAGYKATGRVEIGSATVISNNAVNNIVYVVYDKADYKYTVRYLDSETNQPLRVDSVKSAQYQSVVTSASEAAGISFTGYELDSVKTPASITISINESGNVLNLYYKRVSYDYEIRYYTNFVSEANRFDTVKGSGRLGDTINVVQSQKIPVGYNSTGRVEIGSATVISSSLVNNIVYVVYDRAALINYTIEYYYAEGNTPVFIDRVNDSSTQVYAGTVVTLTKEQLNRFKDELGPDFQNGQQVGGPVEVTKDGQVIKVAYKPKTPQYNVTVNIYVEQTYSLRDYKLFNSTTKQIALNQEVFYLDYLRNIEGVAFDHVDKPTIIVSQNEGQNVMNIYYNKVVALLKE